MYYKYKSEAQAEHPFLREFKWVKYGDHALIRSVDTGHVKIYRLIPGGDHEFVDEADNMAMARAMAALSELQHMATRRFIVYVVEPGTKPIEELCREEIMEGMDEHDIAEICNKIGQVAYNNITDCCLDD